MKKNPKVSVIMASYKHVLWLSETIESVLNQTFKDFEFIIVDDASNDGSDEIIEDYAKKDKRIKYDIFSQNKGAVTALKRCHELSSGEYIAIINSDDVWKIDKLEKQVAILEENEEVGAVFAMPFFIDENSKIIKVRNSEFDASIKLRNKYEWMNFFFKKGNCVCHPTMLIRKECYDKLGFYNYVYRSLPDFEMWIKLFWNYDIRVISEKLIYFRRHSFNESGCNIENMIRCQIEYKQILNVFIEQIETVDEMIEIFPEYQEIFRVKNNMLVPFYLSQVALKRNESFFKDFAFDILYKEMSKPEVLDLIEKNNLYSLLQLSEDVSKYDVYNIKKIRKEKVFIKIPLFLNISKIKTLYYKCFFIKILGISLIKIEEQNGKKYIKFLRV